LLETFALIRRRPECLLLHRVDPVDRQYGTMLHGL